MHTPFHLRKKMRVLAGTTSGVVTDVATGKRIWNEHLLNKARNKIERGNSDYGSFTGSEAESRRNIARQGISAIFGTRALQARDSAIRAKLEVNSREKYPPVAVRRAVCYSSLIYQWATHGAKLRHRFDQVERLAHKGNIVNNVQVEKLGTIKQRSYGTLTDHSIGVAFVKVEGHHLQRGSWTHIYIVFRGSRGSEGGPGSSNPNWAGWDTANLLYSHEFKNVDWRADLDNQQVRLAWGNNYGSNVRVHRGFYYVYNSVRSELFQKLGMYVAGANNKHHPRLKVFVTGHSLGAALATMCAYDLDHRQYHPICLTYCCPRVGNEAFARDFNSRLAQKTYNCFEEGGGFKRSFRFDQPNDPVSGGQQYAFLKPINQESDVFEKGLAAKGLKSIGQQNDLLQAYFHVGNKKQIGRFISVTRDGVIHGMHRFTHLMDDLLGVKASKDPSFLVHRG